MAAVMSNHHDEWGGSNRARAVPSVHQVSGPPCAGKSTFILSHAPSSARVLDDNYLAQLHGGRDAIPERAWAQWNRQRALMVSRWKGPAQLWFTRSDPKPLRAGVTVHLLDPGPALCHARADQDNRPAVTHDWIDAWYATHGPSQATQLQERAAVMSKHHDAVSWGGNNSRKARAAWVDAVAAGIVRCHLCGLLIKPGQPWEVDHLVPLSVDPSRSTDPSNMRPAHKSCNRRDGARRGNLQRSQVKRAAVQRVKRQSPPPPPPPEPGPSSIFRPRAPDDPP